MTDYSQPSAIRDAHAGARDRLIAMARANAAIDDVTHEGDIRGARVESRPPAEAVAFHHHFGAESFSRRVSEQGLPAVEIIADSTTTIAGTGEPNITLQAGRYDLGRAFLGRRSASQVREFDWSDDPSPDVEIFGVFDLATSPVVD